MPVFTWTDEKISLLHNLFNEHLSSVEISYQLNCSYATVLRKAKSIGLNFQLRNKRENLKTKQEIKTILIVEDTGWHIPIDQRKSFLDLKDHHCRYPFNEVGSPDFFFCGATVKPDKPYCETHCNIVYKPYEKRPFKEASSKGHFSFKRS